MATLQMQNELHEKGYAFRSWPTQSTAGSGTSASVVEGCLPRANSVPALQRSPNRLDWIIESSLSDLPD